MNQRPPRPAAIAGARGPILAAALALLGGCAQPVSFDACTAAPTGADAQPRPEDFRLAVLAAPPARSLDGPRLEVELRPAAGDPQRYRLDLVRLPDDPRMVTRGTRRKVDYWHRYALADSAHAEYLDYRARVAAPPGGMAEIDWSAWLVDARGLPAGPTVRELRVRTDATSGYDWLCRP